MIPAAKFLLRESFCGQKDIATRAQRFRTQQYFPLEVLSMVVISELSIRLSFHFLLATLLSPRASSRLRISKLSYQLKPLKAGSNKPTELKDPGRVTSTSCGLLPQFFFCRDNGEAFCVHTYLIPLKSSVEFRHYRRHNFYLWFIQNRHQSSDRYCHVLRGSE